MRSLFFKLFISMWVVMLLSTIIVIAMAVMSTSGPVAEHRKRVREHRQHMASQAMTFFGMAALDYMTEQGPEKAEDYALQLNQALGAEVSVLGTDLKVLIGKQPGGLLMKLAREVSEENPKKSERVDNRVHIACRITGPGGESYILAGILPKSGREKDNKHFPFPPDLWERLAVTFLLCALLCLWLSKNITGPISKLRAATNRVAEGDLSVRVVPALGKRKDEIAGLAQDFDNMAERVEGLVASQKRLLRDISHELRSPLARLNVALELAGIKAGQDALPYLEKIALESERLNELIGQLHTLVTMENNSQAMQFQEVDLQAMLSRIVEDARFESTSKEVSVSFECIDPAVVQGVPELLHRTFENIIRNAVHYTEKNTEVRISLSREKSGKVNVRVQDQGPGVPESELENLAKPFYRVQQDRDRKTGGTGIGLAIASRAIKVHNGQLSLENSPQGGLVVRVLLPG